MKAEDIRRRLAELNLDTNEYRINAGGAMVLYGLREETHDLDIWCTKKLGDALAQRCDVQVLPDGTRRFVPAPDVEIFEKPDVESYENMLPGETVFFNGIPVAPLEDVLALKRRLNREKDQRDIAVLEAAIAARRAAVTLAPIAPEDIAACTELYNYYIENTCITLEEEPVTPEEFGARAARITKDYPYIVARDGAGKPIGFAYLDVFNPRSAYRCTADLSIYVDRACRGSGVGQKLCAEIERLGRERGIENLISIITSDNEGSLRFHRKNGFAEIGVMRSVAFKFGKYLDVSFFQKHIGGDGERKNDGHEQIILFCAQLG